MTPFPSSALPRQADSCKDWLYKSLNQGKILSTPSTHPPPALGTLCLSLHPSSAAHPLTSPPPPIPFTSPICCCCCLWLFGQGGSGRKVNLKLLQAQEGTAALVWQVPSACLVLPVFAVSLWASARKCTCSCHTVLSLLSLVAAALESFPTEPSQTTTLPIYFTGGGAPVVLELGSEGMGLAVTAAAGEFACPMFAPKLVGNTWRDWAGRRNLPCLCYCLLLALAGAGQEYLWTLPSWGQQQQCIGGGGQWEGKGHAAEVGEE